MTSRYFLAELSAYDTYEHVLNSVVYLLSNLSAVHFL